MSQDFFPTVSQLFLQSRWTPTRVQARVLFNNCESARRLLKPPYKGQNFDEYGWDRKIMGVNWGGRPLACGFLWNLTTVRDIFLPLY